MNADTNSNKPDLPLAGVGVLVTRPYDQAANLCKIIENAGGKAIRFPAMEITPIDDPQSVTHILDRLDSYDIAIFISANAVKYAIQSIRSKRSFPESMVLAAIGNATRKALEDEGLNVDIYPTQQFDSEALLTLPKMQQVKGKRILIFRGRGGRELLKNTLTERGAHVDYAELYQRTMPIQEPGALNQYWKQNAIDIVTVTSNQALNNLFNIAGESGKENLVTTPIVVISQRMVQNALERGMRADIMVAEQAGDEAVLDVIQKWRLDNQQE